MSKYIDTELIVNLVRETIKMYEHKIDTAPLELRESIRLGTERAVMTGHIESDLLDLSFEEVMGGMGLCDLAQKIMENCHSLLCSPNTVRSVRVKDSNIIIESRTLSESEIAANATMGVSAIEQFIANINRNKE